MFLNCMTISNVTHCTLPDDQNTTFLGQIPQGLPSVCSQNLCIQMYRAKVQTEQNVFQNTFPCLCFLV